MPGRKDCEVTASGAQVQGPLDGETHQELGERGRGPRDSQHVIAPIAAVGLGEVVRDDQLLVRTQHHAPTHIVTLGLHQPELEPDGGVHRLDGAAEVVGRDWRASKE